MITTKYFLLSALVCGLSFTPLKAMEESCRQQAQLNRQICGVVVACGGFGMWKLAQFRSNQRQKDSSTYSRSDEEVEKGILNLSSMGAFAMGAGLTMVFSPADPCDK